MSSSQHALLLSIKPTRLTPSAAPTSQGLLRPPRDASPREPSPLRVFWASHRSRVRGALALFSAALLRVVSSIHFRFRSIDRFHARARSYKRSNAASAYHPIPIPTPLGSRSAPHRPSPREAVNDGARVDRPVQMRKFAFVRSVKVRFRVSHRRGGFVSHVAFQKKLAQSQHDECAFDRLVEGIADRQKHRWCVGEVRESVLFVRRREIGFRLLRGSKPLGLRYEVVKRATRW